MRYYLYHGMIYCVMPNGVHVSCGFGKMWSNSAIFVGPDANKVLIESGAKECDSEGKLLTADLSPQD